MKFDNDFLVATNEHGSQIRFTKAERGILRTLAAKPGIPVHRQVLLDVISGEDGDSSERNIDYVVNRLRRKLGDSARQPRFIGTQYGEGYLWLADRPRKSTASAFIVIGPLHGVDASQARPTAATSFAERVRVGLALRARRDQPVVFDPHCPPPDQFHGRKPRFSLEMHFVAGQEDALDCALTLKAFTSGRVLYVQRVALPDPAAHTSREILDALSDALIGAIWQALLDTTSPYVAPTEQPLPLRIHEASEQLLGKESWFETEKRLRAQHTHAPDHRLALILATAIHSRGLMGGPLAILEVDRRRQDIDEIERLILPGVAELQDDPLMSLALAKLLYFVDRGHDRLANSMAETAFRQTTALATSYAVWGQMRMFDGDQEGAMKLFRSGMDLAQPNSHFAIYLRVLLCQAALSTGDSGLADRTIEEYRTHHSQAYSATRYMFIAPRGGRTHEPDWTQGLEQLDKAHGEAILRYSHFYCARLFRDPTHGRNILAGMEMVFSEHFGPDFSSAGLYFRSAK